MSASSPVLSEARERVLLLTLAGIQFAHILDFMVMMPLGPILMPELDIGTHEFGLLVSAYTFSAAATGLLAAMFVDRFERKQILLLVFALFSVATLTCALAPGYTSLLLARCAAGAFGGVLGAMVQTMIGDLIPFERRGRANGTVMSAFSLSTVAGVPLSLFLANHLGWRFPFIFIAVLAGGFLILGWRMLPVVAGHLPNPDSEDTLKLGPFAAIAAVLRDANHLKALGFMVLVMFSGFTVIPYISIYLTSTVGIPLGDIPFIYLIGGCATFFSSRWVGRLADAYGKVRVYRIMALASIVPLYAVTHLGPVPLWVLLIYSTLFFIFVPGRMVPAMAVVTSAVQPQLRGSFMSLNGAVQQLSSGGAAYLAGSMLALDASSRVIGYGNVGWLAIAATLAAIMAIGQIALHTGSKTT